jgi:hypothetical protein
MFISFIDHLSIFGASARIPVISELFKDNPSILAVQPVVQHTWVYPKVAGLAAWSENHKATALCH